MKILLLEPYMTDSHRAWAEGLQEHSSYEIEILGLPGVQWKWRMHGAAVYFADLMKEKTLPDLLIVSEMLDLATLKGLLPEAWAAVPSVLYFHENQLTYPWSSNDPDPDTGRDLHYAWIHLSGCLAADAVWFNSDFHQTGFLQAAETFASRLPGPLPNGLINTIRSKSKVLPVGIDPDPVLSEESRKSQDIPVILWNHRWEYDKGPQLFFESLYEVQDAGISFRLVVLGKGNRETKGIFHTAKERLAEEILHWGYVESKEAYYQWLRRSSILPVTSQHDFFGLSVLEAVLAGVQPLLPARLSYPEIFGQHGEYFYQKDTEFVPKLKEMMAQPWEPDDGLVSTARQFVWEKVIRQYDAAIRHIMLKNHHT